MSAVVTLLAGMLFGFGLSLSTMINPQVVLGFLRFQDFGLMLVMGGAVLVALLAYKLVPRLMNQRTGRTAAILSEREQQILRLVASGMSSQVIAQQLAIAPGTVDVHRRNIMRKLDLHSAVDLTRYAISAGMVGN